MAEKTVKQDYELKKERAHDEQVSKMILLYAEIVKLNPAYQLIDNAQSYGIRKGIRLEKGNDTATLYIDAVSPHGYYSHYAVPNYYLRITTSDSWEFNWKKNWTFETKDLAAKVHAKMTEFLLRIKSRREHKEKHRLDTKANIAILKQDFPEVKEIGGGILTSSCFSIVLPLETDDAQFGNDVRVSYNTETKEVQIERSDRMSLETFRKVFDLLKEDRRVSKAKRNS